MAERYARLEQFDCSDGDWKAYQERLEQLFVVNEVEANDEAGRRAALLTVCGRDAYNLLRTLCAPKKPSEESYANLCKKMEEHFNPKPSEVMQRFSFHSRMRTANETVVEYVAALRRIAADCNFGNQLDENLRDRLVCGVNDCAIQRRLLSESNLDLTKALAIATAAEATTRHLSHLQATNSDKLTVGHIAQVCRSKGRFWKTGERRARDRIHQLSKDEGQESEDEYELRWIRAREGRSAVNLCGDTASRGRKAVNLNVTMQGCSMLMELDTGAAVSIISEESFQRIAGKGVTLKPSNTRLTSYTGGTITVLGMAEVDVTVQESVQPNTSYTLPVIVVKGKGQSLLGRNWLEKIRLQWQKIFKVDSKGSDTSSLAPDTKLKLDAILQRHEVVFKEGLGTYTGPKVHIKIDATCTPKFFKARPVPYAQREAVEKELERLEREDIIESVSHSEWASPVVTVTKDNGSLRLCGDYKRSVNPACHIDQYPLPQVKDMFARLAGCKRFTKIDLSQAYLQLTLDEESQSVTTINTIKGLFRFKRLPFGIASASAIFQRTIESVLRGIPCTLVRADDILVSGHSDEEHLANVEKVLARLADAGLKAKRRKCRMMEPEVIYMGYVVNAHGHRPDPERVSAVLNAPAPKNVAELQSYLGMLNYYGQFIPSLATTLEPLHRLLRREARWEWKSEQEEAFMTTKGKLCGDPVLTHFCPTKPIQLACDASPFGVGAVLSQTLSDGSERPVAYASRTLTQAERNYSQFEREALAIVFGVRKFHNYLSGMQFTILTEHKPLLGIFGPEKAIPNMASSRMIRWTLILQGYSYDLRHRAGSKHQNADALSRIPVEDSPVGRVPIPPETIQLIETLKSGLVTAADIGKATGKDPVLACIHRYLLTGWPANVDTAHKKFYAVKEELSLQGECVLRGARMVIPLTQRRPILEELHQGHPGMVRMKALARSFVWWPGIDGDIEEFVKECNPCQRSRPNPPATYLHPWERPANPWERIHVDYASVEGQNVLILVDAHSK